MSETTHIINEILSFAGAILWAGIIILTFSAWIGKTWADIWFKKERELYQSEIQEYKELIAEYVTMLRDSNETRNIDYAPQYTLNTESVLYQNLSESGLELVEAITWLFPKMDELPKEGDDRKKLLEKRYEEAQKKYNNYMRQLGKAAPFINKEIYYMFDKLRKDSHHQILFFPDVRIRKDADIIKAKSTECYANTEAIVESYQETTESLRSYLSSKKISE